MNYQNFFKRYEIKYLITKGQKEEIVSAMESNMRLDDYGRTTIRNLYMDTDSFLLVRRSIEKPCYKEKLRIRSYKKPENEDDVFVELKKKFDSVVYKRRIEMTKLQADKWIDEGDSILEHMLRCEAGCHEQKIRDIDAVSTQICKEIDYFAGHYGTLQPVVFLSYDREAYYALDGSDFRVTFDENILARDDVISLDGDIGGMKLLDEGFVLMELKTGGAIPLWMTRLLTNEKIYPTSFSKYGTYYQKIMCKNEMVSFAKAAVGSLKGAMINGGIKKYA
ncbi:MAG: polyphosphate polymerase domain-containing protein [Clostridium sp.]|nr:polyphosphate polymerase domain-containing protein [Clostridium sp.]MCM1209569.1 polyphosphate polymerase domain-containing protein [Ruminococcus sp.]